MRILIVYYSWTGNTEKLANKLAKATGADLEAIEELRKRGGMFSWLRSGFEALFKRDPDIAPTKADLASYDLVIVGTPIWAGLPSSPAHKFLVREASKIKAHALFCTCSGNETSKAFASMAALLDGEPVATLTIKEEILEKAETQSLVEVFANRVKTGL